MSINNCIICGSRYNPSKLAGLVECEICSFITTNINISDEELKVLYSEDYFHGKEYGDYIADKSIIQKNFSKRLNVLLKHIESPERKSLFEVGCAYGFFLELAQSKFMEVSGTDISEDAILKAKENLKLDVMTTDFLQIDFEKKHDVFCMWDTIEHLKDPHLFLQKISDNINPGGIVAITTGDIGSINARIRGDNWRQIHPPTHLHYFSQKTLEALLDKHGFDVMYVGHPGVYMSLNNIFYIIFVLKYKKPSLYELIKKTGLLKKSIYWNLFDLVYIIGKKR
jgi:SAM-dependent methyltransferase